MGRKTVARIDADGHVIPMTDQELDALDARRRRMALIVGSLGLVLALGGVALASRFLGVGLNSVDNPLDEVTVFSNSMPNHVVPEAAEYRLDEATSATWGLTAWGDGTGGAVDGALEEGIDVVVQHAMVPSAKAARSRTVLTNLTNATSMARNGHLLMVRFDLPNVAADFLRDEPTIFTDPAVEERRDTYLAGAVVVFYSPAGATTDQTSGLRRFLPGFALCAKHTGPCDPGDALKGFDDWAPRAPLSKD